MQKVPTPDDFRDRLAAQFEDNRRGAGPIPFAEFRAELAAIYQPPLRAKATWCKMRQALEIVAELLGPAGTTADLTGALVARYVQARPAGESPYTTAAMLRVLRTACAYAESNGYLAVSPWRLRRRWVRLPVVDDTKRRHHTPEEIGRVLALGRETIRRKTPGTCAQFRAWRTYAVAATAAYTGMRAKECLRLHVADIDVAARLILLVEREGALLKTVRSAAPVAMPDALAAILGEYLEFLPTYEPQSDPAARRHHTTAANPTGERQDFWAFPNAFRTSWWQGGSSAAARNSYGYRPLDCLKRLGARAGVEGFTFLSLRHSYATAAESWGFTAEQIARQLRHTSVKTQRAYRHAEVSAMVARVRGIEFRPPAAPES